MINRSLIRCWLPVLRRPTMRTGDVYAGTHVLREFLRMLGSVLACFSLINPAFPETTPASPATSSENAAQNAVDATTAPRGQTSSRSFLDLLEPDLIYLRNAKGELVPVPRTGSVEDYLLRIQSDQNPPEVAPGPSVARIELTGTADDERAHLTVKLLIRIVQRNGFVRVPLALHEAIFRDFSHAGPGDFQTERSDRSAGHVWSLQGAGDHLVTLQVVVPVKRQPQNWRRLQLTLPEATISSLKLKTPFSKFNAKSATGEPQSMTLTDQPIEVLGLSPRLDVSWQPVQEESPRAPVLEADTKILAHAAPEKLLIEAFQRIHVLQGSVSELIVQLPVGAESIEGGGLDYRAHQILPDNPSRVLVQLNGRNPTQIQLKWTLRLPASDRRKFVLDGFLVEQARKQSAQIGLIPTDGLRMSVSQADHPNLFVMSPNDFQGQTLTSSRIARSYRFLRSPFRITIAVDTIEPYFTSEPKLTLDATLNELTLDGRFSLNVLRGRLLAVELDWPNWKADGWQLESFEPQGELVESIEPDDDEKPGRLRIKLVEDYPERAELRLKARREIKLGEVVPLSLPRLIALDSPSTRLTIREAESMTCELTPLGETVFDLDPVTSEEPAGDGAARVDGKSRTYRIRSNEQLFTLKTIRQERRMQVSSSTEIGVTGSRLAGEQTLHFDVQFERLAQTRLAVPEAWQKAVQFKIDGTRSIVPQWQPPGTDGLATAMLVFPEPRIGQFPIQISFDVRLTDAMLSGEAPVELPVMSCLDHPIQTWELKVNASSESDLTVIDANWKPQTTQAGWHFWVAEAPVSLVKVQCEAGQSSSHPLLITAGDVDAVWDRQGTCHATVRYQLTGAFGRVQLILPPDSQLPVVSWDERALRLGEDLISENQPRTYSVRVPAAERDAQAHSLTVSYRMPATQACGLWNQWSLAVPTIPQARWMAEGRWRIHFPADQHLFSYSSAVTPRFQWQRTGIVFSRVSPPADRDVSLAVRRSNAVDSGHDYAFEQFGELKELRFSTMSGALILFVGATISLAVGFLVLRVAALRHLMTVWVGLFAIAVAGLAFRTQLEVLLQPIVVGFVFPLIAVWIQSLRRRPEPPVMSFDPLMDLVETQSSVTRSHAPANAGEEPVLMRSPSGSTQDFLRTEAGSGVT